MNYEERDQLKEEHKMKDTKKASNSKRPRTRLRIRGQKVLHINYQNTIKSCEALLENIAAEITFMLARNRSGANNTCHFLDECVDHALTRAKDLPDIIVRRDHGDRNEGDVDYTIFEAKFDRSRLQEYSAEIEEQMHKLQETFKDLLPEEPERLEEKQYVAISSLQPVLLDRSFEDDDSNIALSELDSVIEYHGQNKFILRIQHVISSITYSWVSSHGDQSDSVSSIPLKGGLDFNSLHNFQNCKVPPKFEQVIQTGASHRSDYLSVAWRPTDRSQLLVSSETDFRGRIKCKKSIGSYKSVWPCWRMLLKGSAEMFLDCWLYWKISSVRTRGLMREAFQYYLRYATACLKGIIGRRRSSFSCYSHSYGPNMGESANPSETLILGGLPC
jgi:hypothetical protein